MAIEDFAHRTATRVARLLAEHGVVLSDELQAAVAAIVVDELTAAVAALAAPEAGD